MLKNLIPHKNTKIDAISISTLSRGMTVYPLTEYSFGFFLKSLEPLNYTISSFNIILI